MMAMTATLVVFHPAAFAAAWVAEMAERTSGPLMAISSRLPPICFKTQVKLVMASRSFLGVLVSGCAAHATLIRRGCWIIHTGGNYFPIALGIAQERVGACSPISGAAIGRRGYGSGYGRRLESNDMENEKPPHGFAMRGLVGGLWGSV